MWTGRLPSWKEEEKKEVVNIKEITPVREKIRRWEGKDDEKVPKVPKIQSPVVNRGKVTKHKDRKDARQPGAKQKLIVEYVNKDNEAYKDKEIKTGGSYNPPLGIRPLGTRPKVTP